MGEREAEDICLGGRVSTESAITTSEARGKAFVFVCVCVCVRAGRVTEVHEIG